MLTKFKLERWAPLLVLVASNVAACEAAETNDSDDANAADTDVDDDGADSMSSDDTLSGDASSGGDAPPVDVGEPSNVRGATATACQEPGVGEFTCGSMTVVSAEAGQPPIVRVGPEDSPTYLQMVEL